MDYRKIVKNRRGIFGLLHFPLRAASLLYAPVVRLRNLLYDWGLKKVYRLNVPVVVIGNLTMGGTGKTPVVAALLRRGLARGIKPALLSRGYRASNHLRENSPRQAEQNRYPRQNDEAALLAIEFPDVPHYQAADRVGAGRALLADFPQTELIISDDGFQHRRLGRDVNILLVDGLDPFGGGLFPAGFLREPLGAIRRADGVILTRADLIDEKEPRRIETKVRAYAPDVLWAEAAVRPTRLFRRTPGGWQTAPFSRLKEESEKLWVPFCGLGNPDNFYKMLEGEGIKTTEGISFPDHTAPDAEGIRRLGEAANEAEGFLTTMKDLVKLRLSAISGKPVLGVAVELRFLREESFFDKALGWK